MSKNMWNDTDTPLAVFFTFRCYGTWLHGDSRGSVDKRQNTYGAPRIEKNASWRKFNEKNLRHPPVKLNAASRRSVEKAIREICAKRGWKLLAINVRTNHVHVVISIGTDRSATALTILKQIRLNNFARITFGFMIILLGPKKEVGGTCGMRPAFGKRATM